MFKHTKIIPRQQPNCLNVFDHFVGLVLRGLISFMRTIYNKAFRHLFFRHPRWLKSWKGNRHKSYNLNTLTKYLERFYSLEFIKYGVIYVRVRKNLKIVQKKKGWQWWHDYHLVTLKHLIYFRFWHLFNFTCCNALF